ncbi:inositol phospholipid synthesis and fat-storage-inducing TM-domain-containing protein [Fusarium sp. MPI-SDFR-AT-0072]|uniref:Acyl-coenzyme A diphosphatase SCS3 n=1 Tax=Fusarium oxysporum f. sp. rapae TaxID=485398 RepID=A0A8J5UFS9_FUSOX|nr:FIT family protein scs3 [Fusarium oxysporum f. sp. rapae]KAH7171872.1 inositol phospholipid synthesis and fat-storage-inducing TM-domain-containing protein [Fusarium sp. MPI-SDFR-AT-0072]
MVTTRRAARAAAEANDTVMDSPSRSTSTPRSSPFLPTPLERAGLVLFPALLIFGTIFSILSPQTRAAPYDPIAQSHLQDPSVSPSYFARKSNIFNVLFVKRGWAWITVAFFVFIFSHPSTTDTGRRVRASLRWVAVTTTWFLVTQWCFGPALIDRGFRWTGGRCELARMEVEFGSDTVGDKVTAVACKAAGGKWKGGHDISGHVFLLTLGTAFLMQEVGWAVLRWSGKRNEERCVVMTDGALKSANVESDTSLGEGSERPALGLGGKFAVGVMGLSAWMLLMTAIYFHTWFEKFTGLLTAVTAFYVVYIVPRFVPAVRQVIGLPGI